MLADDQLATWGQDHFLHPSTRLAQRARGEAPGRIVVGGEGSPVIDRGGRRMLDGFAGLCCVDVGYGWSEIAEAIAAQARELACCHAHVGHGTEGSATRTRTVGARAPEGPNRVRFGLSGSDADETNLKLVRQHNNVLGRPETRIVSRWRGIHGPG